MVCLVVLCECCVVVKGCGVVWGIRRVSGFEMVGFCRSVVLVVLFWMLFFDGFDFEVVFDVDFLLVFVFFCCIKLFVGLVDLVCFEVDLIFVVVFCVVSILIFIFCVQVCCIWVRGRVRNRVMFRIRCELEFFNIWMSLSFLLVIVVERDFEFMFVLVFCGNVLFIFDFDDGSGLFWINSLFYECFFFFCFEEVSDNGFCRKNDCDC